MRAKTGLRVCRTLRRDLFGSLSAHDALNGVALRRGVPRNAFRKAVFECLADFKLSECELRLKDIGRSGSRILAFGAGDVAALRNLTRSRNVALRKFSERYLALAGNAPTQLPSEPSFNLERERALRAVLIGLVGIFRTLADSDRTSSGLLTCPRDSVENA